jgi:segregation and condensation protein B
LSLKAKIEAVIYASEEPITLAQLASLLGDEAQAELDAGIAQQLEFNQPADDADALNAEVMDTSEVADPPTDPGTPGPDSSITDLGAPGPDSRTRVEEAPPSDEPTDKALAAEQKLAARRLREYLRSLLDQLIADYASSDRGLEIREVAGGYRLATKPEYHDAVRGFVKSLKPPLKLTLQALETLAVIAYKQPVTAPEISEIRGVDTSGVLGSLLTRKLIATAGRKQVIGRPILYKTTKDFLLRFGLKDISELPSIEEFEKLAGELNGDELLGTVQEEIHMETAESVETEPEPIDATPTEVAS